MLISSPLRRGMVLGLLLAILARETAGNKFRVRRDDEGTCKYEGYKPGGGIPNIKDIQSPVCKGFSRTLTFVSGLLANAGNGAAKTMFKVAEVVQKGAKVAKILGGAFAAFGAAFEMVSAQSKPKPDDILKQVDKAFDAITKDINDRLKDMENYVDAKVLGLETKLVNNEFASLKKFLTNCMHETTERAVLKCQQDSVRDIDAASPKFEVFKRDFDRGQNNLNPDQIRRLEAALIPFRDYASLHLFALQTLINAYKDAPDTQEKNNRLKLYMDTLYKQGIRYNKYATWAYERIYYNQVKIHLNAERYILDKQVQNVVEGWANKVNTEKKISVKPNCLDGDKHANINKCLYKYSMRVDGKALHRYPVREAPVSNKDEALKYFAEVDSRKTCSGYINSLKHDLTIYWKKELLSLAEIWNKVAMKARAEIKLIAKGAFKVESAGSNVHGTVLGHVAGKPIYCEVRCDMDSVASDEPRDADIGHQPEIVRKNILPRKTGIDRGDAPKEGELEQPVEDELVKEKAKESDRPEVIKEMGDGGMMTSPELDSPLILGKPFMCRVVCNES